VIVVSSQRDDQMKRGLTNNDRLSHDQSRGSFGEREGLEAAETGLNAAEETGLGAAPCTACAG
jgi:hypothetical protein